MKRIYLAGFDVFAPDALQRGEAMKALCAQYGYEGLFPLDNTAETPAEICAGNLSLLRSADILCANCNFFRGQEPDSGTAFEIGYGAALGKEIWCYLNDGRPMTERVGIKDKNGFHVENFGAPLNLMLAQSAAVVIGDLEDCLKEMNRKNGSC